MNTKKDNLNKLALLLNIRENTLLSTVQVSDVLLKPIADDAAKCLDDDAMKEFNILVDTCHKKTLSLVDDMVAYYIAQYDRHFTEAEISVMIDFYGSPTGRRIVEMTPIMIKETMEYSVKVTRDVLGEVFSNEHNDGDGAGDDDYADCE
jgi:hypothetical protein